MANIESIYGLSPTQDGMLFHTLLTPGNRLYFEQGVFTISGRIQERHFEAAWQACCRSICMLAHFLSLAGSGAAHTGGASRVKVPIRSHDWSSHSGRNRIVCCRSCWLATRMKDLRFQCRL